MVHQSNIGIDLEASKIDLEIQTEHEASPAYQAQELQITTLANPEKTSKPLIQDFQINFACVLNLIGFPAQIGLKCWQIDWITRSILQYLSIELEKILI